MGTHPRQIVAILTVPRTPRNDRQDPIALPDWEGRCTHSRKEHRQREADIQWVCIFFFGGFRSP